MIWLLLAACGGGEAAWSTPPSSNSGPTAETGTVPVQMPTGHTGTSTPTADTGAPGVAHIVWLGGPATVPPGGLTQDHATAALRSDGLGMVVYGEDERLQAVRVEPDGSLVAIAIGAFTNHGQVAATPDGFIVVATQNYDYNLLGATYTPQGMPDRDAFVIGWRQTLLPDVDVRRMADGTVQGIVAATDTARLGCTAFVDDALAAAPCPDPVDPTRATGTVAVVQTELGPLFTWTEIGTDGALGVYVGNGVAPPVVVAEFEDGRGLAGRPMLAVADEALLVTYRGAASVSAPVGSYLWHQSSAGETRWSLGLAPGSTDVERVALSPVVDDLVAVAWEEDRKLWLQLRSSVDGAPVGEPVSVGKEPYREPRRPSVDLVRGDDGGVHGIVSWESADARSEVEDNGRVVRVRRFRVEE